MKKLTSIIALVAITMFAVSCGSGNDPGSVVEKAFNAKLDGDFKTFVDACYFADSLQGEELEAAKQFEIGCLEKDMPTDESTGEDSKSNTSKKVKVLKQELNSDETEATVVIEISGEGIESATETIKLKKDKEGNWKMLDQLFDNTIFGRAISAPSGEGLDLEALKEVKEEITNVIDEAYDKAEDVANN